MKIIIVDGFKIRNTIDVDFSIIGGREIYPYINKGEVWLDKTFVAEKDFFIKLYRKRAGLIRKFGYEKAKKILRDDLKKQIRTDKAEIRTRVLKKIGGVTVYLVRGAWVRAEFDPGFCFGGHGLVYSYIPRHEVWIDDASLPEERKHLLVHELHEFELMSRGMNYNDAHDYASAAEKASRRRSGVARYLKD